MNDQHFEGEIVVTSRIIDYLSSGLYETPAACLKELINNSYDADATLVEVYVKPDANRIIVSDNGNGMDSVDFKKNFSKISESLKRVKADVTENNRPKIGKIGIGFIAANEICDVMQVISTKKGSTEKIDVEINFEMMRSTPEDRRRHNTEFAQADYAGKTSVADEDEHYTHIFLKSIKGQAAKLLAGIRQQHRGHSLYGLSHQSITKFLTGSGIRSWRELDTYSRTMLEIALNVPVPYADDWCTKKHQDDLYEFSQTAEHLNFKVTFDGTELRKPTVFSPESKSIVNTFDYEGEKVSFRSYFFAQHGVLKPEDLNGVLVRIRNSALGMYRKGFLEFPSSEGTLFQKWISVEIWADDRLEDAMNIDRNTLRIVHPAYVELVDQFHKQLSSFIKITRAKLHEAPSKEKRIRRATKEIQAISKSLLEHDAESKVQIEYPKSPTPNFQKAALRKYSTSELFDLVINVAEETLNKTQSKKFLQKLLDEILGS